MGVHECEKPRHESEGRRTPFFLFFLTNGNLNRKNSSQIENYVTARKNDVRENNAKTNVLQWMRKGVSGCWWNGTGDEPSGTFRRAFSHGRRPLKQKTREMRKNGTRKKRETSRAKNANLVFDEKRMRQKKIFLKICINRRLRKLFRLFPRLHCAILPTTWFFKGRKRTLCFFDY